MTKNHNQDLACYNEEYMKRIENNLAVYKAQKHREEDFTDKMADIKA